MTPGGGIEVIEAEAEHATLLARLLELYQYDFTEFTGEDVDGEGSFGTAFVDRYFRDDDARHAFLLRIEGRWAGFALLRQGAGLLHDDVIDMVEFFVLRKYRRRGAGEALARHVFDCFRGRWEVREVANNLPAQAFWRRIIARYSGGSFEDHLWDDERWRGPVQTFDNRTSA